MTSFYQRAANHVSFYSFFNSRNLFYLIQFVKAVYVRRDYELEIVFNVSFEDFQSLCPNEAGEDRKKAGAAMLQPTA
ncbi:hypothetical protein [Oscillibacter sp.]|uniref:hypothetical protein n=1 Tax=Oscillibacter sp. TaxID=1945593 RepID=UPI00289AD4C9|nr:hypothetical protein [Oscillibacter sp.]